MRNVFVRFSIWFLLTTIFLSHSAYGATVKGDLRGVGNGAINLQVNIQRLGTNMLSQGGSNVVVGPAINIIPINGIFQTNLVSARFKITIGTYSSIIAVPGTDTTNWFNAFVESGTETYAYSNANAFFKIAVTANDTTPGFLSEKIAVSGGALSTNNPAANEKLLITVTGGGGSNAVAAGSNVTIVTNVVLGVTVYTVSASLGGGAVTFTDVTNVVNAMILISNLVNQTQMSTGLNQASNYTENILNNSSIGTGALFRKQGVAIRGSNDWFMEPTVIYETGPKIITAATTVFKGWFSAQIGSDTGIRYGESTNGLNWQMAPTLLLTNIVRSFVFTNAGAYYLFGVPSTSRTNFNIYLSSSGTNFTPHMTNAITVGGTLGLVGGEIGNSTVWLEGTTNWSAIVECSSAFGAGAWKLCYLTSANGSNWVAAANNPIVAQADALGGYLGGPHVIVTATNRYLMVTHANAEVNGVTPTDIYLWTSVNRTNWTLNNRVPIIARSTSDEGAGYRVGQVADPHLVEAAGVTYLFYDALTNGNFSAGSSIKMATTSQTISNIYSWTSNEVSIVNGNLGVGSMFPTDKISIRNGGIDFHAPLNDYAHFGIDFDRTGDALEFWFNPTAIPLSGNSTLRSNAMTIARNTGVMSLTTPFLNINGGAGSYSELFWSFAGANGPRIRPTKTNTIEFIIADNLAARLTSTGFAVVGSIVGRMLPTNATPARAAIIGVDGVLTNASGTPDGTKFLADDNSYKTPSGGGTVTSVDSTNNGNAGLHIFGGPITGSGIFKIYPTNDLGAIEALSGTGFSKRTGTDTWALDTDVYSITLGNVISNQVNTLSNNTTTALAQKASVNGGTNATYTTPTIVGGAFTSTNLISGAMGPIEQPAINGNIAFPTNLVWKFTVNDTNNFLVGVPLGLIKDWGYTFKFSTTNGGARLSPSWTNVSQIVGTTNLAANTITSFKVIFDGTNTIAYNLNDTNTPAYLSDVVTSTNGVYRSGGTDVAVADGGTGISSGTSGGVLAFTASGTITSSAALTANAIVIGGGAGAAPSTTTTGAGILTFLGTPSSANLLAAVTDETGSGALVFGTAPQLSTIELGNASDTTLSRSAAGLLAVEGNVLVSRSELAGSNYLTSATPSGAATKTFYNFTLNTPFTNISGQTLDFFVPVDLHAAAVNGASALDIMANDSGSSGVTNYARSAMSTLITSISMDYTNQLVFSLQQGGFAYATNTSIGAGNSSAIISGGYYVPRAGGTNFTSTNLVAQAVGTLTATNLIGNGSGLTNINLNTATGGVWNVDLPGAFFFPGSGTAATWQTNTPSTGGRIWGYSFSAVATNESECSFDLPQNYDGGTVYLSLKLTGAGFTNDGTNNSAALTNIFGVAMATIGTAYSTPTFVTQKVQATPSWFTNGIIGPLTIAGSPGPGRTVSMRINTLTNTPHSRTNGIMLTGVSLAGTGLAITNSPTTLK